MVILSTLYNGILDRIPSGQKNKSSRHKLPLEYLHFLVCDLWKYLLEARTQGGKHTFQYLRLAFLGFPSRFISQVVVGSITIWTLVGIRYFSRAIAGSDLAMYMAKGRVSNGHIRSLTLRQSMGEQSLDRGQCKVSIFFFMTCNFYNYFLSGPYRIAQKLVSRL
jgi:hypothetical protein